MCSGTAGFRPIRWRLASRAHLQSCRLQASRSTKTLTFRPRDSDELTQCDEIIREDLDQGADHACDGESIFLHNHERPSHLLSRYTSARRLFANGAPTSRLLIKLFTLCGCDGSIQKLCLWLTGPAKIGVRRRFWPYAAQVRCYTGFPSCCVPHFRLTDRHLCCLSHR